MFLCHVYLLIWVFPMLKAHALCPMTLQAPSNPFAALGATGSTFGTSGGFSFGIGTAAPAKPAEDDGGADGDDNEPAVEEECQVTMATTCTSHAPTVPVRSRPVQITEAWSVC